MAALLIGSSAVLVASHEPALVIGAQIVLALHLAAASIVLTRLLNDCVPSNVRAGVASVTGTLTWMAFLPFALAFGVLSDRSGVHTAGWMMMGAAVVASVLLARLAWDRGDRAPCAPPAVPATKPHLPTGNPHLMNRRHG